MPTQYKGRTFLTEDETYERLGFSIDDVPQLQSARVFFYRGMADLKPGIPDEEKNVFVDGYFFSDMAESMWNNLAPKITLRMTIARISMALGEPVPQRANSEEVTYGCIESVETAFPCCAFVEDTLIEDKVYSDAESRNHFVSIHKKINGPIYYPEDLVVTAMAELGIPPATHTQDAADTADIDPRERTTLLRIIKTLALAQGLTLDAPHKAAEQVAILAAQNKVEKLPAPKTIAAKLADARNVE